MGYVYAVAVQAVLMVGYNILCSVTGKHEKSGKWSETDFDGYDVSKRFGSFSHPISSFWCILYSQLTFVVQSLSIDSILIIILFMTGNW